MLKLNQLLVFLPFCSALCFVEYSAAQDRKIVRESEHFFRLKTDFLSQNGVQYAFEILDNDDDHLKNKTFQKLQSLDFKNEYKDRGSEKFYVVMARTVYEVDQDISFFTKSQVTDLNYIRAIMPGIPVEKLNSNTFRVESAFAKRPSYRFQIQHLDRSELQKLPEDSPILKALSIDSDSDFPEVLTLQYTDDFGTVMGAKTSKMTQVLSRHIPVRPGRTLVITQMLGLLYNVPPFIVGGAERIHKEFRSETAAVIDRISRYRQN